MNDLTRRQFIEMMAGSTAAPFSICIDRDTITNVRGPRARAKQFLSPLQKASFASGQDPDEPERKDLALSAKAAASSGAKGIGPIRRMGGNAEASPAYVNDGNPDTSWGYARPAPNAWLTLTWPNPVTFRDVMIRQNVRLDLKQAVLQVRQGEKWKTIKTLGNGSMPLPKLILFDVEAVTTNAIRLTGFKGVPNFYEVEVYEGPNSPVINITGDASGHIIGIVTDAFGAGPKSHIPVRISGEAGQKSFGVQLETDKHGMFTHVAPAGLRGTVRVEAHVGIERIERIVDANDLPLRLTPVNTLEDSIDLNGEWKFATNPPDHFYNPDFDDGDWDTIEVPSHWVMKGFESLDGVGAYRRRINIPTAWTGQRIKVHFDGVYSGAEVWFNGKRVGWHEGGFTPFEVDVTEAANRGANMLALRVTENTRSSELDNMSFYADFPLTGIFRKAYVFSVPHAHVERLQVATFFDPSFVNATLKVDLKVVNESAKHLRHLEVEFELLSPDGTADSAPFKNVQISLPAWSFQESTIEVPISKPQHWEAEHPRLYQLRTTLYLDGRKIEHVSRRIGFRQVTVRGTKILINGVPVKFRGTCHHDSDPFLGRAVTPELTRRDLEQIKEANLDALRTSHYPAVEELYDCADEIGVYVEAEAPFCWVGQSHDWRLAPLVIQHTAELLERDRSHPSVIWWSLCNESSWGPIFDRSHEYVKLCDPTRPVSAAATKDLDLATRHNPITLKRMETVSSLNVPVVWDESLCIYQGIHHDGLELWRDPGDRDYYIVPLIPIWESLLASTVVQGSMIWAWADDIFLVPGRGSEFGRHLTPEHGIDRIYEVHGKGVVGDAPWGVVDGWRREKPEFWHTKKLQSPIRVTTLDIPINSAASSVRLRIHNRYEFTNLAELKLAWELDERNGELRPPIAPQQVGEVQIPIRQPVAPRSRLRVRFLDAHGKLIDEEQIRIGAESETKPLRKVSTPLKTHEQRWLEGNTTSIIGKNFVISFDRNGTGIRQLTVDGHNLLYDPPILHILPRDPSEVEMPTVWTWKPIAPITMKQEGREIVTTTEVSYREATGSMIYRITPEGELFVAYDLTYLGQDLYAREIGLRFGIPPWMDTLEWDREGEWSAYPENHIGRNDGKAAAGLGNAPKVPPTGPYSLDSSPMGTNDFRSTKRHFRRVSLMSSEGYGISILSNGKQSLRMIVKSDHIGVYVCDWFGGTACTAEEWISNYGIGRLIRANDRLRGTIHLQIAG